MRKPPKMPSIEEGAEFGVLKKGGWQIFPKFFEEMDSEDCTGTFMGEGTPIRFIACKRSGRKEALTE